MENFDKSNASSIGKIFFFLITRVFGRCKKIFQIHTKMTSISLRETGASRGEINTTLYSSFMHP